MAEQTEVISFRAGKIIGTAIQTEEGKLEAGIGEPLAGPGQKIHVIDLPKALENTTDADALHRQLKAYLGVRKKKK